MHPVLILAAIPLLIRTAVFAQCQGGTEGKLNQQKTEGLREPTCAANHDTCCDSIEEQHSCLLETDW